MAPFHLRRRQPMRITRIYILIYYNEYTCFAFCVGRLAFSVPPCHWVHYSLHTNREGAVIVH
jgi:hypothetical protein